MITRQVNGSATTTTLPLPTNGSNTTCTAARHVVTASTVPGAANALFQAAGATMCSCQYLQWGYWTGRVLSPATQWPACCTTTADVADINTLDRRATDGDDADQRDRQLQWRGDCTPTITEQPFAAGASNNTFNFGNNTGTVSITNFDGQNFTGAVSGSGSTYTGVIAGGGNKMALSSASFMAGGGRNRRRLWIAQYQRRGFT